MDILCSKGHQRPDSRSKVVAKAWAKLELALQEAGKATSKCLKGT